MGYAAKKWGLVVDRIKWEPYVANLLRAKNH